MNRTTIASVAVVIAAVAIAVGIVSHDPTFPEPDSARAVAAPPPAAAGPERSGEKNGVTVTVTPGAQGAFTVVLDTHSGSLDDDIASAAVLYDASETAHRPLAWEGDPPGGHHREGTLRFEPAVRRGPIRLELAFAAGQYVFTWDNAQ